MPEQMISIKRRTLALAALALTTVTSLAMQTPAFAADKVTVAINNYNLGSQVAQFIALEKGYFKDENLDVEFLDLENGPLVVASVLSGDADLASGGANASVFNAAQNGDLKMLAATVGEKAPFRNIAFLVTNAQWDKGIREIKDLGGLRLGTGAFGIAYHYAAYMAGQKYNYKVDQTTLIPLGSPANVRAAVTSGSVDGAVYAYAAAVEMQNAGQAHIVGYAGDVGSFTNSALYTTGENIANRRDVFVRFLRANLRATQDYDTAIIQKRNPDGTLISSPEGEELIGLIAKHIKLSPETIRGSLPYLKPDAKLDPVDLEQQVKVWKSVGMVAPNVDIKSLYDLTVMEDASK